MSIFYVNLLRFMKRRCNRFSVIFISTLLFCSLFPITACGSFNPTVSAHVAIPSFPSLPEVKECRIAVASDLHLNPDNRPGTKAVSESSYSSELIDALLWDAQKQGADILLLTGDICNGGKAYYHAALAGKLKRAEMSGLSVFVIPGNHDLAPITQKEFADLYADFGYAEAFSRDVTSLSYCVIQDDLMLLMMDTAGYSIGSIDLPGAIKLDSQNPFFNENTLQWAELMLKEAEKRHLRVLAAGHYNLLSEISRDPASTGYYVVNGDRFSALLREYGVPLYFSGHTHTRSVYQQGELTELVTEYLLSYPTGYSVLDLSDEEITYTPHRIDVNSWALETGSTDPILLDFSQWQQDELWRYSEENIAYMSERNPLNSKEKKQAAEFFYQVMNSYWKGSLSRDRSALIAMPGYRSFFRCAEGYAYGWWLKDVIDNTSALMEGFTLKAWNH